MAVEKILIVDDEPSIRTLLRCAVSAPEITVLEAESGPAALSLAAREGPFSLVVSDVLMPQMDGIELARKLAAAGHAQRFLFISGYCDGDGMAERTRDLPTSSFLAKPFSIPDLLHVVRGLMEADPSGVRSASVREKRLRTALRRPAAPIDSVRALRRKARRLQVRQDALRVDVCWAFRERVLLLAQIRAHLADIQEIERKHPTRRATL